MPPPPTFPEILALEPSPRQDEALVNWIMRTLESSSIVYRTLGPLGSKHPDYDDVVASVCAKLVGAARSQPHLRYLPAELLRQRERPPEEAARSIVLQTFRQAHSELRALENPAYKLIRGQLLYHVKRHGQKVGVGLLPGDRHDAKVTLTNFHSRKNATLPEYGDLLPLVPRQMVFARGQRKLIFLRQLLDDIAVMRSIQPIVRLNMLTSILAEQSRATEPLPEHLTSDSAPDSEYQSRQVVELACLEVERWLNTTYYRKINADAALRAKLKQVLHEYAQRHAESKLRRVPNKDIVLRLWPELTPVEYEHSPLKSIVNYICVRYRRAHDGFQ